MYCRLFIITKVFRNLFIKKTLKKENFNVFDVRKNYDDLKSFNNSIKKNPMTTVLYVS